MKLPLLFHAMIGFIISLLSLTNAIAQTEQVKAIRVLEKNSNKAIDFASVVCYNANGVQGVYSNESGLADMPLKYLESIDSIKISRINYEDLILKTSLISDTIFMERTAYELNEIVIGEAQSESWGYEDTGRFNSIKKLKGSQLAVLVDLSREARGYIQLKRLNLSFYKNKIDSKIRINLYEVTTLEEGEMSPGKRIPIEEDWVFIIKKRKKKVTLELRAAPVLDTPFFLAIEWLGECDRAGHLLKANENKAVFPRLSLAKAKAKHDPYLITAFGGWHARNLLEGLYENFENEETAVPKIWIDYEVY